MPTSHLHGGVRSAPIGCSEEWPISAKDQNAALRRSMRWSAFTFATTTSPKLTLLGGGGSLSRNLATEKAGASPKEAGTQSEKAFAVRLGGGAGLPPPVGRQTFCWTIMLVVCKSLQAEFIATPASWTGRRRGDVQHAHRHPARGAVAVANPAVLPRMRQINAVQHCHKYVQSNKCFRSVVMFKCRYVPNNIQHGRCQRA